MNPLICIICPIMDLRPSLRRNIKLPEIIQNLPAEHGRRAISQVGA